MGISDEEVQSYLIWVTPFVPRFCLGSSPFILQPIDARDNAALSFLVSLTVFNAIRLGPGVFWHNILRSLGILWELG
jgi:hypothetical protein